MGKRRSHPPPEEVFPTGIFALRRAGADGECGLPCCGTLCNGGAIHVSPAQRELPNELRDVYEEEEWKKAVKKLDQIFDETQFPLFPCIFTHFCIPFLPVCFILCYDARRQTRLQRWIHTENERLLPEGLEWVSCRGRGDQFLVLRWNQGPRENFEAGNQFRRKITREPLPIEFAKKKDGTIVEHPYAAEVNPQLVLPGAPGAEGQQQQQAPIGLSEIQMQPLPALMAPSAPAGPSQQFMQVYPAQTPSQPGMEGGAVVGGTSAQVVPLQPTSYAMQPQPYLYLASGPQSQQMGEAPPPAYPTQPGLMVAPMSIGSALGDCPVAGPAQAPQTTNLAHDSLFAAPTYAYAPMMGSMEQQQQQSMPLSVDPSAQPSAPMMTSDYTLASPSAVGPSETTTKEAAPLPQTTSCEHCGAVRSGTGFFCAGCGRAYPM